MCLSNRTLFPIRLLMALCPDSLLLVHNICLLYNFNLVVGSTLDVIVV